MTAVKHDEEKVRFDLIDIDAITGMANVLTHGAKKYKSWNWAKGFDWSRIIASTQRHLYAFMQGEDIDPESGLPHVSHLMCNAMFLSAHYHRKLGVDDRFKTAQITPPNRPLILSEEEQQYISAYIQNYQDVANQWKNQQLEISWISSPEVKPPETVKQSSSKKSKNPTKKPTSSSSKSQPPAAKKP